MLTHVHVVMGLPRPLF